MTAKANLRVRISADLADIKQGLGLLRGELSKVKADAAKALPGTKEFESGLRRVKGLIGGLFAGVSAGALVKGIVGETGQAQSELAQLRAALKSTREAAGLNEQQLVSMAEGLAKATTHSTGEIIEAQTRLLSYSGIAANEFPRALQLAIDQSIRLGENVLQSAETVGKALEYPAQGVAALTKQGFRFTDAQKAMLKEMEKTGRLAEAQAMVMDVMEESYAGAAAAARATLPGALKAVGNAIRELLDGNGGRGATQLTMAINDMFAAVNSPATKAAFSDLANNILQAAAALAKWMAEDGIGYLRGLAGAVSLVVKNLDTLLILLVSIGVGRGIAAIRAVTAGMSLLAARTAIATVAANGLRAALALLGGPVGLAITALTTGIYLLYKSSTAAKRAADEHNKSMEETQRLAKLSAQAALEDAKAKRALAVSTLAAALSLAHEAKARAEIERASAARHRGGNHMADLTGVRASGASVAAQEAQKRVDMLVGQVNDLNRLVAEMQGLVADEAAGTTEDVLDEVGKAIAGSNALLRDAIERQLKELERMYADHEIGVTSYFRARHKLQEQALDAEIEQARMQLAVAKEGEARRRIEEDIVKLQRDRAEIAAASARDEKKALEALAESIDEVYIARLENEGKLAKAVRARLEEEFRERIVRMQAEGREGEVRTIRLHIDAKVAKAQLSEFENSMSQTLARLQAKETSISAQVTAGTTGIIAGEVQLREARSGALEQLLEMRQRAVEALSAMSAGSPEALATQQFISELEGNILAVVERMDELRNKVKDAATDALTNFFMDLVEGSKSAGEALRDFVRNFAMAMAQVAARALATIAILQLMDALWPGSGKILAATFNVGQHHSGGIAGSPGGIRRQISPMALGLAPRYHTGGIAGLAPDEVGAVLQRGEEVLALNDPRHRNNLQSDGGGRVLVKTPIVAIGERAVADALAGAAGEEVILTHVRNNWQGLTRGV